MSVALLLGAVAALRAAAEKARIPTTGDHPSFGRVDDSGAVRRLDVETALPLCAEISAECEIFPHAWQELIPELRPGNADAIDASMSVAEIRRPRIALAAPY